MSVFIALQREHKRHNQASCSQNSEHHIKYRLTACNVTSWRWVRIDVIIQWPLGNSRSEIHNEELLDKVQFGAQSKTFETNKTPSSCDRIFL